MDKPCPRCGAQDWQPDINEGDFAWFECGGCGLQAARRRVLVTDGSSHEHQWFEDYAPIH